MKIRTTTIQRKGRRVRYVGQRAVTLISLVLGSFALIGCEHRNNATVAEHSGPEERALPATATERFHLQSECVEMGKKVLEDNLAYGLQQHAIEKGEVPKDDVTQLAHYNVKDNHCYVQLFLHDLGYEKYAQTEIYDGQTGELLAFFKLETPHAADGKRTGLIFSPERVPEAGMPVPITSAKPHSTKDMLDRNTERAQAYVDYLMERR